MNWIILITVLLLGSCGRDETSLTKNEEMKSSIQTSPPLRFEGIKLPVINGLKWYPQNKWKSEWSEFLYEKIKDMGFSDFNPIDSDLLELDCLGYKNSSPEERAIFWLVLFASMASQESSFDPKMRFWERPLKEWSEGLLQLSVSNYPHGSECLLDEVSILEPFPNLHCGARIMVNQLNGGTRGRLPKNRIFPKKAYYWSVLTTPKKKLKVINFFKGHKKSLSFCG